ncbi:MAG: hypothetical protein ACOCP8_00150, partial [archaeon]
MATKAYLGHIKKILVSKDKSYHLHNVYNLIVKLSMQIKGKHMIFPATVNRMDVKYHDYFIIRKNSHSVNHLANCLYFMHDKISKSTYVRCINKLKELNIIEYNKLNRCWILKDMHLMYEKDKTKGISGYMPLDSLFFSNEYIMSKPSIQKDIYYAKYIQARDSHNNYAGHIIVKLKDDIEKELLILKRKLKRGDIKKEEYKKLVSRLYSGSKSRYWYDEFFLTKNRFYIKKRLKKLIEAGFADKLKKEEVLKNKKKIKGFKKLIGKIDEKNINKDIFIIKLPTSNDIKYTFLDATTMINQDI